jgi:NADPH-dependent 2,4-dienoyl-CoA reductase/sulfur reductase-like enzyme/nitrite reductase/ring-hydroxylating ferredoxin subunit
VPLASIPVDGVLAGHVGDDAVLLVRLDDGVHAVGAHCTHYGAPLAEGCVDAGHVHCPWHHACFDLRTGVADRAPAFSPLGRWRTEVVGGTVHVREPMADAPAAETTSREPQPRRILVVGGGAAGYAAVRRLRDRGFDGAITMLSADHDVPVDRPNLSKDFLAGTAPPEWLPLQDADSYAAQGIDLRLDCTVAMLDPGSRRATTIAGDTVDYDAALIATGAEPRRLPLPGFDLPHVFALRTLADARAIVAVADTARSVAFVGAGFIGLEAAAALRSRGLAVSVIAPEAVPMARILGERLGAFLAGLHRERGVAFHLGRKPVRLDGRELVLDDGTRVDADLVVVGAGVVPRTQLAEAAGLAVDNGILVDASLQASIPGHYAAGDVARYPHAGGTARVEHWVHAQRQGQCVADNLLGSGRRFTDVPFFWTHQYDVELRATGHLSGWDDARLDGSLESRDFTVRYFREGALVAAATVGRDRENLGIEAELAAA